MDVRVMNFRKRSLAAAVLLLAGLSLAGCVVYPGGYGYGGYGGGYGYGYAPPPVYGGVYVGGGGWGGGRRWR